MKIEIGKYYENKTWRFLLPVLKGHGQEFMDKFNTTFKFAVGVHDTLLDGSPLCKGKNLIIMLDKSYQPKIYNAFMDWIQYQPYFKGEYCPDADFKSSRKHIIILEVPEKYFNAYDMFLKSDYSEMYTPEDVKYLFDNEKRAREYEILSKTPLAYKKFLAKNEESFKLNINPKDFNPKNYEFPLVITEEVFNGVKGTRIFFNEDLDKTWKDGDRKEV